MEAFFWEIHSESRDCAVVVKPAELILSHSNLYSLLALRVKDVSRAAIDPVLEALQLDAFCM